MKTSNFLISSVLLVALLSACTSSLQPLSVNTTQPGNESAASTTMVPTSNPQSTAVAQTAQATQTSEATQAVTTNCTSPAQVTVSETEGPFFKAGSPERSSLLQNGIAGTKVTITGVVLGTDCQPVTHALLDFQGQYDNSGYTLRGHLFTDANGHYQLITIVPGLYPGRTEHIHVKVQAPGGPVLTTQLFFPGVQQNEADSIFDPSLVMKITNASDGLQAAFNFVVNLK
jgi:protocatechuate 3,4-dioxygenase beta subunit